MMNGVTTIMMKRWLCGLLCALILLVPFVGAYASVRMPINRGVLTDDADVLSAQIASDIESYARLVSDEIELNVHVTIVHFLDGIDAQTYADQLFQDWKLGDDDLLLLGAAGEDSFATAMGANVKDMLGQKNAENLMFISSAFSELFRTQQYDAAFGKYFVALNALINKQCGTSMKLKKLFANAQESAQPVATQVPSNNVIDMGSRLLEEVMGAVQSKADSYQEYHEAHEDSSNGMSAGGWIVLAIIVGIIFSQSDPVRKARKRGSQGNGRRGCSPLGWLFSLFGINVLFDSFRRRR